MHDCARVENGLHYRDILRGDSNGTILPPLGPDAITERHIVLCHRLWSTRDYLEVTSGLLLNLGQLDALRQLCHRERTQGSIHVKDTLAITLHQTPTRDVNFVDATHQVSDNLGHASSSCERQSTFLQDLWATILCSVVGHDDNTSSVGIGNEIHCPANS